MTREYEVVYIVDSTLEETQVNELLERHHQLLTSTTSPNPVTNVDHWGKRMLAYPLKKKEQGYFVIVRIETEPQLLVEFERALKLDVAVLRYLVVINEGIAAAVPEAAAPVDAVATPAPSPEEGA